MEDNNDICAAGVSEIQDDIRPIFVKQVVKQHYTQPTA